MPCEDPSTAFDQLASETLFQIFDYLSYHDVVSAFSSLNQRFTAIILHYRRFVKTFTTPTRDFAFWQTILSTINAQIEHLVITTTEFRLSLDSFPNLKSLVISFSFPIDYDELALLLEGEQFRRLNSLKIKNEISVNDNCDEIPYCHRILHGDNSLRIFESLAEICLSHRYINYLKINENLRSLSLQVLEFRDLLALLNYTPNLKYLNVVLRIFGVTKSPLPNINLSHIKLKRCSVFIEKGVITTRSFPFLTLLIRQFSSSLVELLLDSHKIAADKCLFTDSTFEQQLLQTMVQLKSLHLYLRLDANPVNVKSFLSIFQTPFWHDHHWTLAIHGSYLYTLPFHFETLYDFVDFKQIESSNPNALSSCQTWAHIKSIEFSRSFKFRSNLIEQLNLKMPNLTSVILTSHLIYSLSQNMAEMNQIDGALGSIATVHFTAQWLELAKDGLLHIFPNVKRLILTYTSAPNAVPRDQMVVSQELDAYLRDAKTMRGCVYPFKIEYVEINVTLHEVNCIYQDVVHLLEELLKMSGSLKSITFYFYHLPRFPSIVPYTELEKTIKLFNMGQIREQYWIKHVRNYMQFVRI